MNQANHELARRFFREIANGNLPDDLVTDDMTVWTATSGATDRARFAGGVKMLSGIFGGTLEYQIDSLTAEEDRVAAQVRGTGTLINGEPYENIQLFLIRVRDGRIASVIEHMNQDLVRQKIVPLLQAAMAKPGQ